MSAALPARAAGQGVDMRDAEAMRRLLELLASLRHFQAELEDAEGEGLRFVAERAREEIREREDMIRRHCAAAGLEVPQAIMEETGALTDGSREDRARRAARRLGFRVRKIRSETPDAIDFVPGTFLVVDPRTNGTVAGGSRGLTLDELEGWLARRRAREEGSA